MNEIEKTSDSQLMESVLLQGDLSKLTPEQRVNYYQQVCKSVGLNPLTRPFDYITLNGKLILYAKKDCTDQLRNLHQVSIDDVDITESATHFSVKVKGHDKSGRSDVDLGVVIKTDMQGNLANLQMKAVTKGKRRLTLSLCGLGWLDETEVETIPNAQPVIVTEKGEIAPTPEPKPIKQPENEYRYMPTYEEAAAMMVTGKDKNAHRLDSFTPSQLQWIVEHAKTREASDAAMVILANDYSQVAPEETA